MIVVTGATGQLGRLIVHKLVERVPAAKVAASCREPESAADLRALGVRVRRGDFEDASSLASAFEGATQVMMVSSNARSYGGDSLAQHRTAIAAARAAGAKRIVYTSHTGASHTSLFPPMLDHALNEALLEESGLAWTSLRNGFYAQSGLYLLGDAAKTGVVEAPEDGKVSWTAHVDLAEAAAAILANEGSFEGPTPPLTGSEALDLSDIAALAAEVWGRPVRREVVEDDAFRSRLVSRGTPSPIVDIALGMYRASRAGEFGRVDKTLETLLGRAPTRIEELLVAAKAKSG